MIKARETTLYGIPRIKDMGELRGNIMQKSTTRYRTWKTTNLEKYQTGRRRLICINFSPNILLRNTPSHIHKENMMND